MQRDHEDDEAEAERKNRRRTARSLRAFELPFRFYARLNEEPLAARREILAAWRAILNRPIEDKAA